MCNLLADNVLPLFFCFFYFGLSVVLFCFLSIICALIQLNFCGFYGRDVVCWGEIGERQKRGPNGGFGVPLLKLGLIGFVLNSS